MSNVSYRKRMELPRPLKTALMSAVVFVTMTSCRSPAEHVNGGSPVAAEQLLRLDRPLVIAHRGFSSVAPENTLAAFERAVAAKADLTELDYHHSRDGRLVVIHDATLDRTTDATNRWGGAKLPVAEQPFARLRELEAGRWFTPPYAGLRLPELGEALAVIQRGSVTLIERKAGDAAACVALIREQGLLNQVVIQSFDWEYLRDYHAREPAQILGALGPPGTKDGRKLSDAEKRLNADWCESVRALGARVVVWNREVDRSSIAAAHQRGLKVWVYTINEEPLARQLLDLGVDGLITDRPALMQELVARRAAGR